MATPVQNYLCTWVINLGRQGWKEEWYLPAASPAAALAVMQSVTPARIDLFNPIVQVDQLKVSDVLVPGDSLPDYSWVGKTSKITAGLTRDETTVSLLCRAGSVQVAVGNGFVQYQRSVELTGLPDEWCTYDALGKPQIPGTPGCPAAFTKAFNAWAAKMQGNGFCIQALDKAQVKSPVRGVYLNPFTAGGGSSGKILLNVPGHGMTATNSAGKQTSYRVKGVKFLPTVTDPKGLGPLDMHQKSLVNRVQMWEDITQGIVPPATTPSMPVINGQAINATDWLQLAYDWPTSFPSPTYIGGGYVQQRVLIYAPLGTFLPPGATLPVPYLLAERFGSRDRGRAYFVPRGRARKRAC